MSPNARDRARAKRRYEKRQATLAQRRARTRRNRQVVAVGLAALLVIGSLVALASFMGHSGSAKPAAASTTTSPAPSTSPTASRALPPKSLAAGRMWTATLTTNQGQVTVDLDGVKAPQTVASFISLARSGYWAGSACHRLTTAGIFVLQCGDPTGTGNGNPGYGFGIENAPKDGSYPTGTLAMARTSDPNSNGGQFFIVYKPTSLPTDGGGYSIFGKVTKGLGIVDTVAAKGVAGGGTDGKPALPLKILKVVVAEKKA